MRPGQWHNIKVAAEGAPRLDQLVATTTGLTRSQAQRLIEEGQVRVNGAAPKKAGQKLEGGEELSIFIPPPRPSALQPQNIPLHILFQDSDLAVIEKPAGLVVHPAAGHEDGTLVNALLHHLEGLSSGSGVGGELRPGIVHRIDRWTSGILLVTKTDAAHLSLSKQFKDHTITRRYRGLCWGKLPSEGEWNAPLARDPRERKRIAIIEGGKRAITRYRALRHFHGLITEFEAELLTGRTHQVRVHFASHGYPLLGDSIYATSSRAGKRALDQGQAALKKAQACSTLTRLEDQGRQCLHAAHLSFDHPRTGERLSFSSPLPSDLSALLQELEKWKR